MLQSRLRGGGQSSRSRHDHYPIPSARGEARVVCQREKQQRQEYACDNNVAHAQQIDVSDTRLMSGTINTTAAVFKLLPRLLPPMTYGKQNPNAIFEYNFIRILFEPGPSFSGGGRPENGIQKYSVEA